MIMALLSRSHRQDIMCAASSQGGAITVFDMSLLNDTSYEPEQAILCTFRSSRPTLWGCVRAMTFSPRPWDLLGLG